MVVRGPRPIERYDWPDQLSWNRDNGTTLPDPDEIGADASAINATIAAHVPDHLRAQPLDMQAPAGLSNVFRRMKLNHADDILTTSTLVEVTNDVIEALPWWSRERVTAHVLNSYLTRRFIVPRYRIQIRRPAEQHPLSLSACCRLDFNDRGQLTCLHVDGGASGFPRAVIPDLHPLRSPVAYYRAVGRLVENPAGLNANSKAFHDSVPVFLFSQVWDLLRVHRALTFWSVNLVATSPEAFEKVRERLAPDIRATLQAIGTPRFCARAVCLTPLVDQRPRRKYCSAMCRTRDRDQRKKSRKPR